MWWPCSSAWWRGYWRLHWKTILIYLDGVIVFCQAFEQELERLPEVFGRFRDAHIKLSPEKCCLFQKVQYLSHIVSEAGVHTDPEKMAAVKDWPAPINLKDL